MKKCQNCGEEINENDKFCTSCGAEIEDEHEELNDKKKAKTRKINGKVITGIALIVIVILVGAFFLMKPEDVELEAEKLASMISEEKSSEYYGDNLHVHGYLLRDTREHSNNEESSYYTLVSDIENLDVTSEAVVFMYDEVLAEEIGSGSEVIIHGKLREETEDVTELLIADEIEIKKKEEPVYTLLFDEIESKHIGEKIQINGRLIDLLGEGHYITDYEINNVLQLKGLTEAQFADYFKNGSIANVIGKLNEDGTIDVEKIIQNEDTKEMSYDFGYSVSECYDMNFEQNEEITIHGKFLKNPFYSVPYAIGDEETSEFIEIRFSNSSVDLDKYFESGGQCVISGYISEGGRGYVLNITGIG